MWVLETVDYSELSRAVLSVEELANWMVQALVLQMDPRLVAHLALVSESNSAPEWGLRLAGH